MKNISIFKIYLLVIGLSGSLLSFAEDNNEGIDKDLLVFLNEGKFAQFKKLYDSTNLNDTQKAKLIKMADEIIER